MIGGPSGKCRICQCENGALPSEYVELTAKAVLEPNSSASARYRTGGEAGGKTKRGEERGAYVFCRRQTITCARHPAAEEIAKRRLTQTLLTGFIGFKKPTRLATSDGCTETLKSRFIPIASGRALFSSLRPSSSSSSIPRSPPLVVFAPPHTVRDVPTLSTAHVTHAHSLTPRRAPSCHTLPAWPAAAC